MTPKEKAKELINKFYPRATSYSLDRKNQNENAKKCALIAIDEILKAVTTIADKKYDYFVEVKHEIGEI